MSPTPLMLLELRYSCRSLLRTPLFFAAAVLILALAIGANTAVFSLMYGLVLRPLPVPSPHELVQVSTRDSLGRVSDMTWGQFLQLRDRQHVFSTIIGSIQQGVVTVEAGGTSSEARSPASPATTSASLARPLPSAV